MSILPEPINDARGSPRILQLFALRFLLSDRLLPAVAVDDAQRQQNRVWNPEKPPVRSGQAEKQPEKNQDSDPAHSCRFDHEGTFARPVSVFNAKIGSNHASGEPDNAARDSTNPSPQCS